MSKNLPEDFVRKLGRAELHLKDVQTSVERLVNEPRHLIRAEFDAKEGQHVAHVPKVLPEEDLPLIIGDCIQNARAALDYLMCALVRSTPGGKVTDKTEFPIFIEWPRWAEGTKWSDAIVRKIAGSPPGTEAFVKRHQPFAVAPQHDPDDHPLASLYVLSNRDKHRSLSVVVSRANVTFTNAEGESLFAHGGSHGSYKVAGTPGEPDRVTLGNMDPGMEVYLRTAYDVVFDENGPPLNREVLDVLRDATQYVEMVGRQALGLF